MKAYKLILLVIISIFFTLCNEEDEEDLPEVFGSFTVDGISYNLHDGLIFLFQNDGDTVLIFGCYLHSSGIYYENDNGYIGTGNMVKFFMMSDGNYGESISFQIVYDTETQINEAFDAKLIPGYESNGGINYTEDYYVCTSGTIDISGNNNITTINMQAKANKISCVTEQIMATDIDVSVDYTGEL